MDNKCQHYDVHYSLLSGGWLILFAIMLRLVAACPASCSVCTKDVTLCHQLTYIVGNNTSDYKAVFRVPGKFIAMLFNVLTAFWAQPKEVNF